MWTAGHELGHVWKVDQYVKNNCANCSEDIETIIGKFTAELLMPKENFRAEIQEENNNLVKELHLSDKMQIK